MAGIKKDERIEMIENELQKFRAYRDIIHDYSFVFGWDADEITDEDLSVIKTFMEAVDPIKDYLINRTFDKQVELLTEKRDKLKKLKEA